MSLENPNEKIELEETAVSETADDLEKEALAEPVDPYASFENPEVRTKEDVEGTQKKKKRIVICAIIGAIVLLAVAIVLLVFVFPSEAPIEEPVKEIDTSVELLDKTPADSKETDSVISSVTMESTDGKVEFLNKDGKLLLKGYENVTMHAVNLGDLETLLTKLVAIDDIGKVEKLADYGFDKPQVTVKVTYTDKTSYTWEIGDMAPDQTGCYFREADSKHVYILDINDVAILLQDNMDYISTSVFTEPAIKESAEGTSEVVLRKMTLSGAVRNNEKLSFRLVTSDDSDAYIYYSYVITEPYLKGANSAYDTQLEAFTNLGASAVVKVNPTAADKKKYGFDEPYSVLEFTLAKRTTLSAEGADGNTVSTTTHEDLESHTLYLTKADSDYYYAMIDDKPIIYLVAVSDIGFAAMQYDDFADTLLFLEDITQIGVFEVTTEKGTTKFELTHNSSITDTEKNMTVKVGDKTYDTMDFRYLVNNFMAINRYEALKTDVTGLPLKMEFSIYHLKETAPALTVKFYEISPSKYAAILSHGEEYVVKAEDVNFVIAQCENYLNGKTVLRK